MVLIFARCLVNSETYEYQTTSAAVLNAVATYGLATYNESTYGVDAGVVRKGVPATKSGRVIKVGVVVAGATNTMAINRVDLYAKVGKVKT